jgi:hypothetical protein
VAKEKLATTSYALLLLPFNKNSGEGASGDCPARENLQQLIFLSSWHLFYHVEAMKGSGLQCHVKIVRLKTTTATPLMSHFVSISKYRPFTYSMYVRKGPADLQW